MFIHRTKKVMTYIEKSEKEVSDIRKRQNEFVKCVDNFFNKSVDNILKERYDYQMRHHHSNMVEEKIGEDGGHKKCLECGWECWWNTINNKLPEPPIPYEHESSVERL